MKLPIELKLEILQHYTDEDGMVTIDRDPTKWSSGNGLLHTGLARVLYKHVGIDNNLDGITFRNTVAACEVSPGLYNRNPKRSYQNGHDDYTGVVSGSVATESDFQNDVVTHGVKNLGTYNDDGKFKPQDFLFRQFWHTFFWFIATKRFYTLPLVPILLAKLFIVRSTGYSILHTYMMLQTIAFLYPRLNRLIQAKIKRLGLVAAGTEYFKVVEHPVVQLLKKVSS